VRLFTTQAPSRNAYRARLHVAAARHLCQDLSARSLRGEGITHIARDFLQPRPRKIIVVDDSTDTAQSFALLLRSLGHHAEFITDARAVMGTVRRERPDAVFLDIGMPHMDGFELARLLKREFEEICVVAITGHGSDEDRRRGREAGFDAYITKPVDMAMLQSILDTLFAPRSAR